MKTYLLVDAKNCLFRHNYTSNLTAPNGQKISGVFGMIKDVTNLVREFKPDFVVLAWDKGHSKMRKDLYPEYKANRKKDDPEFLENVRFQVKEAKDLFKCLPVIQISVENTEADDVIGFFTKKVKGKKIIASNDTDFLQLVDEDTKIVKSRKGVMKEINHENIREELGFDPKLYVLHKSLTGDSSDNIFGVPGIGEKTATKIVNKEIKKDFDKEIVKRNIKLITIEKALTNEERKKILESFKEERKKRPNLIRLRAKMEQLRFNSILANFTGLMHCYKEIYQKSWVKK